MQIVKFSSGGTHQWSYLHNPADTMIINAPQYLCVSESCGRMVADPSGNVFCSFTGAYEFSVAETRLVKISNGVKVSDLIFGVNMSMFNGPAYNPYTNSLLFSTANYSKCK